MQSFMKIDYELNKAKDIPVLSKDYSLNFDPCHSESRRNTKSFKTSQGLTLVAAFRR